MTSLATQLQKRDKQLRFSAVDSLASTGKRPSLLFDADRAADIDKDSIFAIGSNGFLELIQKDMSLSVFKEALFSDRTKTWERLQETAEENKVLDAAISNFLIKLSPFASQQCSLKVLEWLIRQFRINEFNVSDLIECFLPFHDAPVFVLVVAILDLDRAPARWGFLKAIQKNKVPLTRTVLVQRCMEDRTLLRFVLEMVSRSTDASVSHRSLWAFLACLATEYFQKIPKVDENDILSVIDLVVILLNKNYHSELQTALLMIIGQLGTRTALSKQLADLLTEAIAANVRGQHGYHALLSLISLCQTQEVLEELSPKCMQQLTESSESAAHMSTASCAYNAERFLIALFLSSLKKSNENSLKFVYEIVEKGRLSSKAAFVLSTQCMKLATAVPRPPALLQLAKLIQNKYTEDFNRALNDALMEKNMDEFTDSLKNLVEGSILEPVGKNDMTLLSALRDSDPIVQVSALRSLNKLLESGSEVTLPKNVNLDKIVFDTLSGNNEEQIEQVLSLSFVLTRVKKTKLCLSVCGIMNGKFSKSAIRMHCVEVLTNLSFESGSPESNLMLQTLFGELLLSKEDRVVCASAWKLILQSESSMKGLLRNCEKSVKKLEDTVAKFKNDTLENEFFAVIDDLQVSLIKTISENVISSNKFEESVSLLLTLLEGPSIKSRIFSVLILTKIVSDLPSGKQIDLMKEIIPKFLVHLQGKPGIWNGKEDSQTFSPSLIHSITKSKRTKYDTVSQLTISWSLNVILSKFTATASNSTDYLVNLYKTLATNHTDAVYQQFVTILVMQHWKVDILRIFPAVISTQQDESQDILLFRTLGIVLAYVKASRSRKVDFQLLIPSLLVALLSANADIRKLAMACLSEIFAVYNSFEGDRNEVYGFNSIYGETTDNVQYLKLSFAKELVMQLIQSEGDILADESAIRQVLLSILSKTSDSKFEDSCLQFLVSNVLAISTVEGRIGLLTLLKGVPPKKLKALTALMDGDASSQSPEHVQQLELLLACFDVESMSLIKQKDLKFFDKYLSLISYSASSEIQMIALKGVTNSLFKRLDLRRQSALFDALLNLSVESTPEVVGQIIALMDKFTLTSELVLDQLASSMKGFTGEVDRPAKRVRDDSNENDSQASIPFRRLTVLIELLNRNGIVDQQSLVVRELFALLEMLINTQLANIPVPVEYLKQLVITGIEKLVVELKDKPQEPRDATVLQVDKVVQCIRGTENAQTINYCLNLLATITTINSRLVVTNIMPIFTFMGNSVLRHDDNYSFSIIHKILQTVIPPLIESHRDEGMFTGEGYLSVRNVIQIFCDAIFHIPKHRRLRLFVLLIKTLGEEEFLVQTLSLCLLKLTEKSTSRTNAKDLQEFCQLLSMEFTVPVQLNAFLGLLRMIASLDEGTEQKMVDNSNPFDVASSARPVGSMEIVKNGVTAYIDEILTQKRFTKLGTTKSDEKTEKLQLNFLKIVLSLLGASQGNVVENYRSHYEAYLRNLHEILNKINGMLSLPVFLATALQLLQGDSATIRRQTLQITTERISSMILPLHTGNRLAFAKLVNSIVEIVLSEGEDKEKIYALESLAASVNVLGDEDPSIYVSLMKDVIERGYTSHTKIKLATATFKCLRAICHKLGKQLIPILSNKFAMKLVSSTDYLTEMKEDGELEEKITSSKIEESIYAALHLYDELVIQVAGYVTVCVPKFVEFASIVRYDISVAKSKQSANSAAKFIENIAKNIPSRTLVPSLKKYIGTSPSTNALLVTEDLVTHKIQISPAPEVVGQHNELFTMLLGLFVAVSGLKSKEVRENAVTAFLEFSMKLNETVFRPLFLRLLAWSSEIDVVDAKARKTLFYQVIDILLGKLKAIFTPYFGYLVDGIITHLKKYADESVSVQDDELWQYLISSSYKFFLHGNLSSIGTDNSANLAKAIMMQMDVGSEEEGYLNRMMRYIIPCIGQLAVAGTEPLWKVLNAQTLQRMKNDQAEIRCAAVLLLCEFYTKIGEEYLVLLPETVPAISELMEDDDENVQKYCQKLLGIIQNHLGEDLNTYF
ncbi:HEAT repeat-containing protein 1 [Nowakowskiella sp. JEL0407]|nr:HEAT repeat-containing protein 1 [Nowakowskiella sp. JEL0407]